MSVGSSGTQPTGGGYLYLVYAVVALYAICQQLQQPLEPFLVDKLVGHGGASAVAYGRLQSTFQIAQMVGSFFFGSFLDKYGVRVGFIVNFIACATHYALLANATSLPLLFLSKAPGIAASGFLCAQTAVSHMTPDGEERIVALGRLGTSYAIGGILGPAAGGRLGASGDYYTSAWLAVVGSFVAAGLCCFLPSGFGGRSQRTIVAAAAAAAGGPPVEERLPWHRRSRVILGVVGYLMLSKLVGATANSMVWSTQSLILKNELGFSEMQLGLYMSGQFTFNAFVSGLALAHICRWMGGQMSSIVRCSVMGIAFAYFGLAVVMRRSPSQLDLDGGGASDVVDAGGVAPIRLCSFVGLAMINIVFQCSLATTITAECTQRVPKDMKGTLIGMEHSLFAAARSITPALGIGIFTHAGSSALYATCGTVFFVITLVWWLSHIFATPRETAPKATKELEFALAA